MTNTDRASRGGAPEPTAGGEPSRGAPWQPLVRVVGTGAVGIAVLASVVAMAIVVGLTFWPGT